MPITYTIRPDLRLIVITHTGIVEDEEFIQAYARLSCDEKFDITYNRLVDLRNTDSRVRSTEALRRLAKIDEAQHEGIISPVPKTAVIAPSDLSYGLTRMYNAMSSDAVREFAVFKTAEEGLAWLDLPSDVLSG